MVISRSRSGSSPVRGVGIDVNAGDVGTDYHCVYISVFISGEHHDTGFVTIYIHAIYGTVFMVHSVSGGGIYSIVVWDGSGKSDSAVVRDGGGKEYG